MNPPSALYSAMNKDRKPFTYTPGGIDLSEIKSERMAQRLMRNAMSEGVSETSMQMPQSPPVHLNTSTIPNFNCLPVQVFPTFPLPENPKSLLRTRSNPDAPKEIVPKSIPTSTILADEYNKTRANEWNNINNPSQFISNSNINSHSNDNRSSLINDYTTNKNVWDTPIYQPKKYGSNDHTEVRLPDKSYDAEYFVLEPEGNIRLIDNKTNKIEDNFSTSTGSISNTDTYLNADIDIERNPLLLTSSPWQDSTTNDFEQKEVKIVKKQTKTENDTHQNNTEAAVVVKLPAKKSSAKTETKVEVLKKTLPDGSIEEVTTTITKTTIDGKTEIKTETETRILPGEEVEEEEIEEIEEESEDIEEKENKHNEGSVTEETTVIVQSKVKESSKSANEIEDDEIIQNGQSGDEKSEISIPKQEMVIQSTAQESEEEEEEEVEEEEKEDYDVDIEQVIVLNKQHEQNEKCDDVIMDKNDSKEEENQEEEEEEEEEKLAEKNVEDEQETVNNDATPVKADVEVEEIEADEEDEVEEDEIEEQDENKSQSSEKVMTANNNENEEEEKEEEIVDENHEIEDLQGKKDVPEKKNDSEESLKEEEIVSLLKTNDSIESEAPPQETIKDSSVPKQDINMQQPKNEQESIQKRVLSSEPKVSFREPSIPLDKVEDIEIRPIGPAQEIIKKCHTEIITTTKDEPTGALSTQTEYNRIENIVTVNRTTKTLDNAYEQAEHTVPTVKPYIYNDRVLSTPQPISRPYQPVYTPEPPSERRHSLLLDRLSVERQIPIQHTDIYQNNFQNNTQSYEQNQWQEPQSEVLTVSNVKPSTITKNQQWYQQSRKEENVTSNILTPTPIMPSQLSQPQAQAQPQYQSYVQPQYKPKIDVSANYMDNIKQTSFKTATTNLQPTTYPTSYTPKPTWVSSTYESKPSPSIQPSQYSTLINETKDTYQKSTQQFSSSYVPPPWEQDSSYIAENQNLYQAPPQTTVYSPNVNQTWKPKQSTSKFSKPTPTSYIPPAPNQSFVKPVTNVEANMPGRKTYYSEYERRYISVPESTYIPNETKFQAQPDPSPQYYFDNNEPVESVEPQWRKELREFTEKTSQTTTLQTENISVRPPWEDDPKYAAPQYISTVTPSWTQTLRPRSWRERSFEPEYMGSKEWPKTNTLGRGRPQSSYAKQTVDTIQERPRGVSVDRYNPSSYQSPLPTELPPVHSHTLNVHPKAYHNPNVPAYHARTSAESREQPAPYTQRTWGEARAPPVQSRSFKYLQWITGTED